LETELANETIPDKPRVSDPLAGLVAGVSAGDQAMMCELVKKVSPAIRHVVRLVMGRNHPDRADVTQECLMVLRKALQSFRNESSVAQFACQVAMRTALTARRRSRSQDRIITKARLNIGPDAEVGPSPDDPLEQRQRAGAFQRLMQDLPESQAETFMLRVILDYSLPQVALATGVSINTVRSRVRLAKEKLKERLRTNKNLHELLRS
jgi:RNA polymerase sigma-70 factor (ECF subfamily)